MRVALVRRVILREDHAVRWPFKVAADPPTGQEAKPLGVRQDLCALGGAKGIYRQGPTGPGLRHANQDSTDCEEKANIEVQSIMMTPAPGGPPPLSEAEFWRDYDLIRDDVNAAMLASS